MFPEINKRFRFQVSENSSSLKVPPDKFQIIEQANIDSNNLSKDNDNNFIINQPTSILNILGAHFASVNVQNQNLGKPALNRIIKKHVSDLEVEFQTGAISNNHLVEFNSENLSVNPTFIEDDHFSAILATSH